MKVELSERELNVLSDLCEKTGLVEFAVSRIIDRTTMQRQLREATIRELTQLHRKLEKAKEEHDEN